MRTSDRLPEYHDKAMADLLKAIANLPDDAWDKIKIVQGDRRKGMSTVNLELTGDYK